MTQPEFLSPTLDHFWQQWVAGLPDVPTNELAALSGLSVEAIEHFRQLGVHPGGQSAETSEAEVRQAATGGILRRTPVTLEELEVYATYLPLYGLDREAAVDTIRILNPAHSGLSYGDGLQVSAWKYTGEVPRGKHWLRGYVVAPSVEDAADILQVRVRELKVQLNGEKLYRDNLLYANFEDASEARQFARAVALQQGRSILAVLLADHTFRLSYGPRRNCDFTIVKKQRVVLQEFQPGGGPHRVGHYLKTARQALETQVLAYLQQVK